MGMMFHFSDEDAGMCFESDYCKHVRERENRFETPEAKRQLRQLSALDIEHLKTDLRVELSRPVNFHKP